MKPVFILGNIGSGTTVLHKTLLRAVEDAVDIDRSDQESRPFWMKHGMKFGTALTGTCCRAGTARCISAENKAQIQAAFQRICSQGLRVITKNPHFCNKIPLLHDLFPDALYIYIVRQDLSVVASMKRMFIRFYEGETPWGTSCVHYWPDDDRPCWSVLSRSKPTTKNVVLEKLRRFIRHRVIVPTPDFADWTQFRREHADLTRYFPGGGFGRLEEAWIKTNLNIVLDVEDLRVKDRYFAINYRSLVEQPERIFGRIGQFLRIKYRNGFRFDVLRPDRQDKWRDQLTTTEVAQCNLQRDVFQSEATRLVKELPGPLFAT